MSVAAVLLAAGASRRLGRPKQDEVLGGETLLARAVRVATQAGLLPVIVVVPRGYDAAGEGVVVVANDEAAEGIASSIRAGVRCARDAGVQGVVMLTCDQVALRAEHLRALYEEEGRVTGSGYAGRVGIPAYFPERVFADLLALRGDTGARELLRNAFAVMDESLALDVDTEEDLLRAKV